jgi:hypothetical protein
VATRKPRPAAQGARRRSKSTPATSRAFTDAQLAELVKLRQAGSHYGAIAEALGCSAEAARRAYNNYHHLFETDAEQSEVKALLSARRQTRARALAQRQTTAVLDWALAQDAIMDRVRDVVADVKFTAVKLPAPPRPAHGHPDMTMELMVSDVHVGKRTPSFDLDVCRARLDRLVTVFLQELDRKRAHYNVHRVIVAFLGDNIENAMMHGLESLKGCEFGNSEQVWQAINLFFHQVLVPIAATGLEIDVVGVAGNHDREGEKQTYAEPGKSSLMWIVYNTLQLLCERAGFTNIRWNIPTGAYAVLQIYRDHILYEHGDFMKGGDRKTFRKRLADRSTQLGVVLRGLRLGHWHEYSCYDNGMAIVNASVCGEDSYSDVNAYGSRPGQVITYYVRTDNRDNDYYYSFLVQL